MADEKNPGFLGRLFGRKKSAEPVAAPAPEEVASTELPEDAVPDEITPEEPAVESVPEVVPEEPVAVVETPVEPVAVEEPAPAPTEQTREKLGFFARLRQGLSKTKRGFVDRLRQLVSAYAKIDEALIDDVEMAMVQADIGIETTGRILDEVRRSREARHIEDPAQFVDLIKDAILGILEPKTAALTLRPEKPTVVLVIGVNGVGKTTTIGKLAAQYREQGKKVMMVAGDTFRAAAVEQLAIWADRTGSLIVKKEMGADAAAVCHEALAMPEARDCDVILIDTAGRLHNKSNLMKELEKILKVIGRVLPGAPHESLLVLDATTGQNAISQAKLFSEVTPLTGFIMTKLDGTAKGGVLIALCDQFEIPVLKIGIGEGQEDLREFEPKAFVEALFEG
jgi:fused signal recognition particle receptor